MAFGLMAGLTIWLGYFADRADTLLLFGAFGFFFLVYYLTVRYALFSVGWSVGLGMALRLSLLFSVPNLSDDVYRFIWDGRLATAGVHPFLQTPEQVAAHREVDMSLYALLNSREYHTVYPPVCQGVFALGARVFPDSVYGSMVWIKAMLILAECLMLWHISSRWRPRSVSAYAFNPLVILEIAGNAHFEGLMLLFLMFALGSLKAGRTGWAGVWLALSIATKLLPLLLLPLIWRFQGLRRGAQVLLVTGLSLGVLFLPWMSMDVIRHFGESLNLYFRQFEFNASVYYVVKYAVKAFSDPEVRAGAVAGPALALLTFVAVIGLALWPARKKPDIDTLTHLMTVAVTIYLFNSSTVHPWYVIVPFALSLRSGPAYPLVWTGLVFLSYSHYAGGGFAESYPVIALEYLLLLAAMVSPCRFHRRSNPRGCETRR